MLVTNAGRQKGGEKQRSSLRSPIRPIRRLIPSSSRHGDYPIYLPTTFRHRTAHLPRQHVPEIGKSLTLALEILVPALH